MTKKELAKLLTFKGRVITKEKFFQELRLQSGELRQYETPMVGRQAFNRMDFDQQKKVGMRLQWAIFLPNGELWDVSIAEAEHYRRVAK